MDLFTITEPTPIIFITIRYNGFIHDHGDTQNVSATDFYQSHAQGNGGLPRAAAVSIGLPVKGVARNPAR